MAQPLSEKAPIFCVALFGSNNRFEAIDVANRWKWMSEEARKHNISLLGFSSDGDTRLLKCMQNYVFFQKKSVNGRGSKVVRSIQHYAFKITII